jgi:hypothetical protein
MAGYEGDAHHFVNHRVVPLAQSEGMKLIEAVELLAREDPEVDGAFVRIPKDIRRLFAEPELYVGDAQEQALKVVELVQERLGLEGL